MGFITKSLFGHKPSDYVSANDRKKWNSVGMPLLATKHFILFEDAVGDVSMEGTSTAPLSPTYAKIKVNSLFKERFYANYNVGDVVEDASRIGRGIGNQYIDLSDDTKFSYYTDSFTGKYNVWHWVGGDYGDGLYSTSLKTDDAHGSLCFVTIYGILASNVKRAVIYVAPAYGTKNDTWGIKTMYSKKLNEYDFINLEFLIGVDQMWRIVCYNSASEPIYGFCRYSPVTIGNADVTLGGANPMSQPDMVPLLIPETELPKDPTPAQILTLSPHCTYSYYTTNGWNIEN